jgi:hypothetical protein
MSSRSSFTSLPIPAESFLKSGIYLRNWSTHTLRTYPQGLVCLYQSVPEPTPKNPQLNSWVIAMRDRGLTPVDATCISVQ